MVREKGLEWQFVETSSVCRQLSGLMGNSVYPVERHDAASKAAGALPTEAADHPHPAPSEEDISRFTRLGMRRSGVESWFEMTAHPYTVNDTVMAVFLAMVASASFWCVFIFIVSVPLHILASRLLFVLPSCLALFFFVVLMTIFWVFGPRSKLMSTYHTVHALAWSAIACPLFSFSVVEEAWAPFQNRVVSATATPFFFSVSCS